MHGFANRDVLKLRAKGHYNPNETALTLLSRVIQLSKTCASPNEKTAEPRTMKKKIELYSARFNSSHVVMFDGKKIVPNFADIYLTDEEDNPKLSDTEAEMNETVNLLELIINLWYQHISSKFINQIQEKTRITPLLFHYHKTWKKYPKARTNIGIERVLKQF